MFSNGQTSLQALRANGRPAATCAGRCPLSVRSGQPNTAPCPRRDRVAKRHPASPGRCGGTNQTREGAERSAAAGGQIIPIALRRILTGSRSLRRMRTLLALASAAAGEFEFPFFILICNFHCWRAASSQRRGAVSIGIGPGGKFKRSFSDATICFMRSRNWRASYTIPSLIV